MKNKQRVFSMLKHPRLAHFLVGVAILVLAAFFSIQSDLSATRRVLMTTANYIKEQCNRYGRIELAAETKSLMRIMESSKQIAYQLEDDGQNVSVENLKRYASSSYVSGIVLLNGDGTISAQYHSDEQMLEPLMDALQSPALRDIAKYPEKRYAVRLRCDDGCEIDLAATGRMGEPGIVVAYYRTPKEYIEAFDLSITSLLSGYSMKNNGAIVVSRGDDIVASNDPTLMGHSINEYPILRKITAAPAADRLTHGSENGGFLHQQFGLMDRGREVYVYALLPEHSVFPSTPWTLFYTLIAYTILLLGVSVIRWKAAQRAQAEFSERLQDKNEQLSEAVQEADRANAAKTSFLSRMSHDIRTPLNGIIGLLEIDAAHPEDRALIDGNRKKMQIAADHLLSLINDVLQMSKLESGEITLAHEPLNLGSLSTEVLAIIDQRAAESGITMEYDRSVNPISAPWVYGSPLHLRQIFLNIYTNCIKYNKVGGSISTQVQCLDYTDDRVTYRWTITDTGIGMSEAFLQQIFDPFTQENTDARSVYQGTGLGMTIVKGLLERMNGSIEVHSQEGIGSTFVITIPFELAQALDVQKQEAQRQKNADIRGFRLLLAEDNDLNAEIARMLLEDAGAEITWVGDGQQAVDRFRENPAGTYDAILMDIMMPVMDGLTAAKTIRATARPDAKTIPIIAMTANAFAEDAQRCMDAGMNAHLAKPLDIQKVMETISDCVSRSR